MKRFLLLTAVSFFQILFHSPSSFAQHKIRPPAQEASPLVQAVQKASKEFQVPDRLLLAIAYEGTRFGGGRCDEETWSSCGACPSCRGDDVDFCDHPKLIFGPFGLSREEIDLAGKLLGTDLGIKEVDCNVEPGARAQAALLRALAKSHLKGKPSDLQAWRPVLAAMVKQKYPGLENTPDYLDSIADSIWNRLQKGAQGKDAWGMKVVLEPASKR